MASPPSQACAALLMVFCFPLWEQRIYGVIGTILLKFFELEGAKEMKVERFILSARLIKFDFF